MSNSPEIFVGTTRPDRLRTKSPELPSSSTDTNRGIQSYLLRPDPEDCKCDVHGIETGRTRYRQLADKERRLYDELIKVNREMMDLTSSMLDGVYEKTLRSIYKTDYERRGLPVAQYRSLMAAIDSPVGIMPVGIIDSKKAYKDPTTFRYSAIESLQPVKSIKQKPCSFWDELFTGSSEYMDTISKVGSINIKNQQQYSSPLSTNEKT